MQMDRSLKKSPKKALIAIPDAPSVQVLIEKEMIRFGYNVSTFKGVDRAWSFFEQETPLLVVLSSYHHGLKAVDLCRRIRRHGVGRYTTILVVTTSGQAEEEEALAAGANLFLDLSEGSAPLRGWGSATDRHVTDLMALKQCRQKTEAYQKELDFMNDQLEEALTNANKLAVEAELAYLEMDQIFKTAAGGILVIDPGYNVLRYNEALLTAVRLTRHEMEGKKCYEAFGTRLCHSPDCPLEQIQLGRKRVEHEVERKANDGSSVFHMVTSTPLRGPSADLIAVVTNITDITSRVDAERALRKNEERFRELSILDDLTTLYNKRHLNTRLQSEIDRALRYRRPLSLMLIDIDNFKHFNDTYGHTQGDQVLAAIGQNIIESIRSSDSAYRYGGEEFVVLMPETPGEAAINVAERIREKIAFTTFSPAGEERIHKTVSIGLTQYSPQENEKDLIARADQNMYQAKKSGKNRVIFS